METNQVTTSDIYEATYYFLNGAEITGLFVVEELKKQICKVTLSGEILPKLQQEYFQGLANVNLFAFRRGYNRLINLVTNAKREIKIYQKAKNSGGEV